MAWRIVTWTVDVPDPSLEPSLSLIFDGSNDSFVDFDWVERPETDWVDEPAVSATWTNVPDTSETWAEVA